MAGIRVTTVRGLLDGYGVEDIAAQSGLSVEDVRREVDDLRQRRLLNEIIRQARRKKWRAA